MKESPVGWSVWSMVLAAHLTGGSLAWGQAAPPALPPLPPGIAAPRLLLPDSVQRRPASTNPVANPFVLPGSSVRPAAISAPPAPLAPPAAPAPVVPPPFAAPPAMAMNLQPADASVVKFDAELKEYTSKPGEMNAPFQFWLTNVSTSDVLINNIRTSCGCTVAKLPNYPWRIPAGGSGPIDVNMNLAGKAGSISKGVTIESSVGIKMLTVKANITPSAGQPAGATMADAERLKNMQMALADRQVVFTKQECATCHADPAKGKVAGVQIYAAVCATCHDSQHRAAMVPDLRRLNQPTDAEYWRRWTAHGRAGSMMPAFAKSEGGPLDDRQIDALVAYLVAAYPNRIRPASQASAPAPTPARSGAQPVGAVPAPKVN